MGHAFLILYMLYVFSVKTEHLNPIMWQLWESESLPSVGLAIPFLLMCAASMPRSSLSVNLQLFLSWHLSLGMCSHLLNSPIQAVVFESPDL
jgi:hypothetical protein